MLDANGFLGRLLQDPAAKGAMGGVAGGAMTSLLMNKKARKKLGKTAVNAGGVAALAGVAYWAYQKYQGRQAGEAAAVAPVPVQPGAGAVAAPPAGSTFLPGPNDTAACNALALKLVRAMISRGQRRRPDRRLRTEARPDHDPADRPQPGRQGGDAAGDEPARHA